MFFSKMYIFIAFTSRTLIHSELIVCMWYKVGVQTHSFACRYPVLPALLVQKTVLSPLVGLTFTEISWWRCMFLDYQIYFLSINAIELRVQKYMSVCVHVCLMPVVHCFWLMLLFGGVAKLQSVKSSYFFFSFFQNCFGYLWHPCNYFEF